VLIFKGHDVNHVTVRDQSDSQLIADCFHFRMTKLQLFDYDQDLIVEGIIDKIDPTVTGLWLMETG
jgi:hypothetical protein